MPAKKKVLLIETKAAAVPVDAVKAVLNQRGARYGDFTDHAEIAQDLQDVMRNATTVVDGVRVNSWDRLSKVQKQALTVDADKTARILSGDPDCDDNWIDKQGYARLVQERLPAQAATEPTDTSN